MTTDDHKIAQNDVEAAVAAGIAVGAPHPLPATERFHTVLVPDGADAKILDLEELVEWTLDHPRRKKGSVTVRTAASLTDYLARHAATSTEVWADRERLAVLAVVDGHATEHAGHREHTATLALRHTPAWKAWTASDGVFWPQEQFIEHVEKRLPDFVDPPAAAFLEIVSTFKSLRAVDFEAGYRSASGETTLEYRETQTSSAGKKGDLQVPERFELGLVPFEGADRYRVSARLRWRIADHRLVLGYVLDRPEEILDTAFNDVVNQVGEGIDAIIFTGWPW